METTIRVIGDVHGIVRGYLQALRAPGDGPYDMSVQLGDFGFAAQYDLATERLASGEVPDASHVFFGGNHDDYHNLPDMHLGDWGEVPGAPGVWWTRGARSLDASLRTPGYDWWPEEEISPRLHDEVVEAYVRAAPRVVLTHDGPGEAIGALFPRRERIQTVTEVLLSRMLDAHRPEAWLFGHWHRSRRATRDGCEFACVGCSVHGPHFFDVAVGEEGVRLRGPFR